MLGIREGTTDNVIPLGSRKWAGWYVVVGVAAALIAVVIGIGILLSANDEAGKVLATATLVHDPVSFDSLGDNTSSGASLISHDDKLTIEIVDSRLPDPGEGADLEVWLIQPDDEDNVVDLVSLGVVDPDDSCVLEIASSHDPAVYYVVDISIEPQDGDPSHSGRTILRGPLTDL